MLAQRICLRNTQNSNSSFSMPTAVFQNGTLLHVEQNNSTMNTNVKQVAFELFCPYQSLLEQRQPYYRNRKQQTNTSSQKCHQENLMIVNAIIILHIYFKTYKIKKPYTFHQKIQKTQSNMGCYNQVWWIPVSLTLGKLRQKNCHEFKATQGIAGQPETPRKTHSQRRKIHIGS